MAGAPSPDAADPSGAENEQQEKARQMQEQRHQMLQQIMTGDARERLARVAVVKPDVARRIEEQLLGMAQGGRLKSKVSEQQIKDLLESVSGQGAAEPRITFQRKKRVVDSDESDDDWEI